MKSTNISMAKVLSLKDAATTAPLPRASTPQRIYVYNQIRTKQVVYSLTKALDVCSCSCNEWSSNTQLTPLPQNKKALAQIPFMGKKTVPAVIRKDMWRPLCVIQMPSQWQALRAYQELREFKKRHEHEWHKPSIMRKPKAVRKKRLMNQKANSIADIAFVLCRQNKIARSQALRAAKEEQLNKEAHEKAVARLDEIRAEKKKLRESDDAEAVKKLKELKVEKMRLSRNLAKPMEHRALEGVYSPFNDSRPAAKRGVGRVRRLKEAPRFTMEGIKIWWSDIYDAEHAKPWPEMVEHEDIQPGKGAARHFGFLSDDVRDETLAQLNPPDDPQTLSEPVEEAPPSRWRSLLSRLQSGRKDATHI